MLLNKICGFLFAAFMLCGLDTFAQEGDTVYTAKIKDTLRYHLTAASTGSLNQTNANNTYLLNNAVKLTATHRLFTMNATGSYIYGQSNKVVTNNDVFAAVDGNVYRQHSQFFYWVLVNYTSSLSLKINGLFQGGGGAAYDFIKEKNNRLNISDGILYEKDDLYIDTLHDIYHTFRNSFRLSFKWTITKGFIFEGTNFIQNSLTRGDDYILKSNLGLSIVLYKWLSLTSAFVFNRFNRTNQQNLLLNYGLKVEKDF